MKSQIAGCYNPINYQWNQMDKQEKLQDGINVATIGKSNIFKSLVHGGSGRSWDNYWRYGLDQ